MQQPTQTPRSRQIIKGVAIAAASVIGLLGVLFILGIVVLMQSGI